jgi:F5/8 type C domain
MTDIPRLRKRPLEADAAASGRAANEIDIAGCATVSYSSEDPAHPVEHLLDGQSGPGATRWMSARADTIEHIVLEFDRPQTISRLVYEVEEARRERTQEVRVEVSEDGARTYRQFWFRNTISAPGEPPINAKNSALISTALPISVLRLFRTRTAPARRLLRRYATSLRRLGFECSA